MFKNFIKIAWRNLVKNKGTTVLNIVGLAIGITTCLVIGIWLERELSFDNFHPHRERIYRITNTFKSESESFSQAGSGVAFGAQLTKQIPAVKATCRYFRDECELEEGNDQFIEQDCVTVDSNFFSFFGFKLLKGDPSLVLNAPNQIVLTQKLAIKYFGNEDPIGKTMILDGRYPMVVSGIAANPVINSHIQFNVILPYSWLRKKATEEWKFDIDNMWSGGWPYVYVQLHNESKWKEAELAINKLAGKSAEKEWKENKMSYQYHLQPLVDIHLKSNLRYDATNNGSLARVKIFSIVGIIVLLLACINYINLTTAGAINRARETSVRKVIGATKLQLIRQFFLETLIVCSAAVIIGLLLVKIMLPGFSSWIGQPYSISFTTSNCLLLIGFVLLISIIAGLYPAAMLSSFRPAVALKGNFSTSIRGNFIRRTLVVFQFTMTVGLIAAIIIISQQMNFIKNKSLGFDGNAVIEVPFYGVTAVIDNYTALRNDLMKSSFIKNVTKHQQNVVGGLGNGWTTTENLKGEEISTSLYMLGVDTTYMGTYNLKLVAGRFFSRNFPTDTTKAVLVNEAAVNTFGWKDPQNAIGKRFGKGKDEKRVIGVLKDFHFESLHKRVEALLITYAQGGNKLSLKIDGNHIDEAIAHLKSTWAASVQEIPLNYKFVDETVEAQYQNETKMQGTFYAFAGVSLLIACLGLFGLSTFIVKRKVKEIGVRKVLGASVMGIVQLLSKDFMKLVLISLVIASPVAWYFMHRWLDDFAYRVEIKWWIFLLAGFAALLIALITVSFQSIRAALANPVKSLRTE
ncbi:MAG TPA: ABC transporter permease [Chitinophagaceae bacterium]|nr:ABC transporter permease [Chitinophagaceae bacterium]